MDAERTLDAISRAFKGSAFADRVMMALAKVEAERILADPDKQAIQEAVEFFKQAQNGYNWIKELEISSASQRCAVSFQTAVRSLTPGISPSEFSESLQLMLRTVQAIKNAEKTNLDELKRTRSFFRQMLRAEVNDFDELLSVPTGRTGQWEVTTQHSLI